ncbi:nitroreductase family protein [Ammoniphilus sp. CFH 90114]|uniref:nitroreductase family protein n=1 Tax=Ammoniphilus sp. CFH 90114 TaxID=2493665 RepID=UPI00100FE2AB|nr:nitroreductase family protein [Ammoniphilus sp. CFH 90114]RXT00371.1 hypothetical protein EIZ39_25930 [Ammoniphilus sp. CFH 90114]
MAISTGYIPLNFERVTPAQQYSRLDSYVQTLEQRKGVLSFSDREVSEKLMEKVIETAGRAPSGANQQPWTYVLIKNPDIKKAIREAAEQETGESKECLEQAPYLVALFKVTYGLEKQPDGSVKRIKHYYVPESTPLSSGFFIAALQHAGLDCIVHPVFAALQSILSRPKNEKPCLLFAVGYAKEYNEHTRKPLSEILIGESPLDDFYSAQEDSLGMSHGDETQALSSVESFLERMKKRRNVRHYSTEDADINLLYQAVRATAATPSAGSLQPFRFAIVSDSERKQMIRELAEIEERKLYEERISDEWREALAPLGTNASKPHLTDAPHLIIAFYIKDPGKNNYDIETASMAVGILMGALHHAGLCTLTHTPSPMAFLRDYLGRPTEEMPFIVLPVGYPIDGCQVPDITKKPLSEILVKFD